MGAPRCCRIHAAGDGMRPRPWRKGPRRLPFHLLVLSLDGAEDIAVDGVRERVPAGGVYLIAAGRSQVIGAPAGNRPVFVHFDLHWDGRAEERARWQWFADRGGERMPPPQPSPNDAFAADLALRPPAAVERLIRRRLPAVVARWRSGDTLAVAEAENALEALLIAWARAVHAGRDQADGRLARAEAAALQRLASPAFGVRAFAAAAGLGRSRFHALYRRLRGESPGDFLRRARLETACAALGGGASLAAAAAACGFADRAAFSRFFARGTGVAPGRWRASVAAPPPAVARAPDRPRSDRTRAAATRPARR